MGRDSRDTPTFALPPAALAGLVCRSEPMRRVIDLIHKVAPGTKPVMIRGESGTGKEAVARAIHELSPRRGRPFVAFNCAELRPDTAASQLLGHAAGAFTGADAAHAGLFVEADGGTLFLDEVAEMTTEVQAMLLRVLQVQAVRPLGGSADRPVDVRVVTATHADLLRGIDRGNLRADFYARIRGPLVQLPPLRERRADVPLLVEHFLGRLVPPGTRAALTPEAMGQLASHPFPRNVRELEQAIEAAVLVAADLSAISSEDLNLDPVLSPDGPVAGPAKAADDPERLYLPGKPLVHIVDEAKAKSLVRNRGNCSHAARELGVARSTMQRFQRGREDEE